MPKNTQKSTSNTTSEKRDWENPTVFWGMLLEKTEEVKGYKKHHHLDILDNVIFRQIKDVDRYYHTYDYHVCDMWNHAFNDFSDQFNEIEWESLLIAILFHDVVLVPGRQDNEEKSAELAHSYLNPWGKNYVPMVCNGILATATHVDSTPLGNVLIDLDLRMLGETFDIFIDNCWRIMHEYALVCTPSEFMLGRYRFFKQLEASGTIFRTKQYQKTYEGQAKENLERFYFLCKKDWGMGELHLHG